MEVSDNVVRYFLSFNHRHLATLSRQGALYVFKAKSHEAMATLFARSPDSITTVPVGS